MWRMAMDTIRSLEKSLGEQYAKAPHLPKNITHWIADNIWWLVIIGVVLSALSILALLPLLLFSFGLTTATQLSLAPYSNAAYSTGVNAAWLTSLVSLAGIVVTTVLEAMAISPLKHKLKKGWTLLFIVALFNLGFGIVSAILTVNLGSIFFTILGSAIWGYVLFEIYGYFATSKVAAKKATAKA